MVLPKDEQPADENQSSLEDYFTQSEEPMIDSEGPPSDSPNSDNPSSQNDNSSTANDVTEEEDATIEVSVGDRDTPENLPPSFLLSVDYSGALNKAVARLYRPDNKQVYFWVDNTGHKPYCYTDWPPQAVESSARKNPGFLRAEAVELHDLLKDESVKMMK